jgi:Cellulase (glycosyl hydrolase family 5)
MSLNVQSGAGQIPTFVFASKPGLPLAAISANVTTAKNTAVTIGNVPGLALSALRATVQKNQTVDVLNVPRLPLGTFPAVSNFKTHVNASITGLPLGGNGRVHTVVATSNTNAARLTYTGQIVKSGKRLSNGSTTGILIGANMSGMENSPAQGNADWSDDGGVPNWTSYATWGPNVVRIPLNAASFLGLTCGLTASQAITFTAIPALNSTGGTLTANWTLASGTYPIAFSGNNPPYTIGTFTNGNASVTWAALSQASPGASAVAMYWGTTRSADPNGTYRASIKAAIDAARGIGCYTILDLHWCAPKITIGGTNLPLMPLGQSAFADADTALPFWQALVAWLITTYGSTGYKDIIFELFNEPYLSTGAYTLTTTQGGSTAVSADAALLSGGWSTAFVNNTQGGANFVIPSSWRLLGYQEAVNAIRAAGANNLCIVNGNLYAQQLATALTWKPTDAQNQVVFGWHSYPHGTYPYSNGDVYPVTGADAGGGTSSAVQWANALLAANECVLITEDGGHGGTGATSGEPHLNYMNVWAQSQGVSRVIWQWNSTRTNGTTSADNFLTVFDTNGTTILPIAGAGQVTHDWMTSFSVTTAQPWTSRIANSGVVWYHSFDTVAEVDKFRWAGGYGNDPNKTAQYATTIISWQASGGADGGSYMRMFRPAGTGLNETYVWWRQFSPLDGASNGRGVNDPAAAGTLPLQTFNPTSAGQQTTQWARGTNPGWYGKPGYEPSTAGINQVTSIFDGHEFYLQLRVRTTLDRMTTGNVTGGKFTNFTDTIASHTNQELVTTSGYPTPTSPVGGPYQPNLHFMYEGAFTGGLDQHPGIVHNTVSPQWAYSGGWDTLLYHFIPGTNNVFDTVLQVWAMHPGESAYTKIWDLNYRAIFDDASSDPTLSERFE